MDLANQTLVEDRQYENALTAYQGIISDPPTAVDSAFAVVDYSVTALRAQLDSIHSSLDSYIPCVSASDVLQLRHGITDILPHSPQANHEYFAPPPTKFTLESNYPNPFNAITTLRYYLPEAAKVRLDVFNTLGQKVTTLVDARQESGYHTVEWNGSTVASGLYISRMEVNGESLTHKMLLLK